MISSDPFLTNLLRLPQVSEAYLSPDGHWAAFPWFRKHPTQDIFVVPTDGRQAPFALTNTVQNSEFVSWAPNSRSLVVSQDQSGDERFTLFRIFLDHPGEMVALTEPNPPFFLRSGELSPDGGFLIYAANYDFDHQQEIIPTWIIRHDLATGRRQTLARPKEPEYILPDLNLSGTHVLYNRLDRHPAGRQIYLVDVEGKHDEEILNFGDDVKTFARWLPDGENIIVVSDTPGQPLQRYTRLGIYHHPTRKLRWLLDDPRRNIQSAWPTPDGLIVVNEMRSSGHTPSILDPQTGKETQLPLWPGNLLPLGKASAPLPDGRDAWVAISYAADRPAELVRFTIDADGPKTFTSLTPAWEGIPLSQADLFPAEELAWKSSDGLTIHGWLYHARPNRQRAILYIHGGPTFHSENRFNAEIQYLVKRGFNVLDVNYRGSTGYGAAFRERMKETGWGTLEMDDIVCGAQKLVELNLSRPGSTGITGTSYGGYCAWYLITHQPPEVIAAAAPICGLVDLVMDYHTTRPDLRLLTVEMMGGTPDEIPERYHQASPIQFIDRIRGKLLIIQGMNDPNVTPENMAAIEERLQTGNIPYEKLVFPDEGHGIRLTANQYTLYQRLADFFDQTLG